MSYCIYIIEDDKNIAELLEIALKSYNYNVLLFEKAEDAIKTLNKQNPDLIICDIMLPGIDGIEATSIIRKNSLFKTTPIIMLTAKDSELDKIPDRAVKRTDVVEVHIIAVDMLFVCIPGSLCLTKDAEHLVIK